MNSESGIRVSSRHTENVLTVFQTADARNYFEMLLSTSRTVREFCRRSGSTYECFIGVKRGFWNWQSTYNRIHIFSEIYDRGWRSWVLYLDADAYIWNLNFNIHSYLEGFQDFGAIMTPSGATSSFWDVNAGVLLINLGNPTGVSIVKRWATAFNNVSDEILRSNETPFTGPEDQVLLHNLLKADESLWPSIHLESADLMNSVSAAFIRQNLRSTNTDFTSRQLAVREAVDKVMGGEIAQVGKTQNEKIVSAAYQAILGRNADNAGFTTYSKSLEANGLERGLAQLIRSLLTSQEYRSKEK